MIGTTNPLVSPPGTVRADLAVNVGRNVIHGSDGVEGATSEIPLWFKARLASAPAAWAVRSLRRCPLTPRAWDACVSAQEGEVINIDSTQWPHHVGLYLYDTKQA